MDAGLSFQNFQILLKVRLVSLNSNLWLSEQSSVLKIVVFFSIPSLFMMMQSLWVLFGSMFALF